MPEPLEKKLIDLFATAWSDATPGVVGAASELTLIAQREAVGAEVRAALESAPAFPVGFATNCSGALTGLLLCLFKKEDRQKIELFISKTTGNQGIAGTLSLFNATLATTSALMPEPTTFGAVVHADLTSKDATTIPARLLAAAGESVWVNTLTLTIGERLNSQMMVLYAPHGSVDALLTEPIAPIEPTAPIAPTAQAESATVAATASASGGFTTKRHVGVPREDASRNMDRLLEIELEVVVRFGLTQIPLRELVRVGVGSMIELNRQVDEPVELLVNHRLLARGSVVVVDGYYGVCITEIGQPEERQQSFTKT